MSALDDPVKTANIWNEFQSYMNSKIWYSTLEYKLGDLLIAFFSMEFGIDPSLPIYSGGLGVLASDHLKSASDLGLPLIGVGLFYHKGFFQQVLDRDGYQVENYPEINVKDFPATIVKDASDSPILVSVDFADDKLFAQIWLVKVGRVNLYLLDSNISQNKTDFREITARLYDGGRETRIQQEILLDIGGVRALAKMNIVPAGNNLLEIE